MLSEKAEKKLKFIMLPRDHWDAKVDKLQDFEKPELAQDWIDNTAEKIRRGDKGLYIHGKYAVGKSSFAGILAKLALSKGVYSLWINYRDLPKHVAEKTLFTDNQTIMDRAEKVDLLIIDEFYPESRTKFFPIKCFDDLLRTRHQESRPTIITSNCSPTSLVEGDKNLKNMLMSTVSVLKRACISLSIEGDELTE